MSSLGNIEIDTDKYPYQRWEVAYDEQGNIVISSSDTGQQTYNLYWFNFITIIHGGTEYKYRLSEIIQQTGDDAAGAGEVLTVLVNNIAEGDTPDKALRDLMYEYAHVSTGLAGVYDLPDYNDQGKKDGRLEFQKTILEERMVEMTERFPEVCFNYFFSQGVGREMSEAMSLFMVNPESPEAIGNLIGAIKENIINKGNDFVMARQALQDLINDFGADNELYSQDWVEALEGIQKKIDNFKFFDLQYARKFQGSSSPSHV